MQNYVFKHITNRYYLLLFTLHLPNKPTTKTMETLSYEQTIELEANIKIKNKAEQLYRKFLKNIKLNASNYKGNGKFLFWSDEYNATYFQIKEDTFYFICEFLHENYTVCITPDALFNAIKKNYRGIGHFESAIRDRES